jgi:hypothetical protein
LKIKYKEGICNECGETKLIVQKSLGLCTRCNQRRLTKRYNENRKKKQEPEYEAKLNKFYRDVWDNNTPVCYESGSPLFRYHKWHVHHILDKQHYPNHIFNHDVCVLLSLEKHSLWHTLAPSDRKTQMPKTYQRYLELLKKYDRNKYNAEINSGIDSY